MARAREQGGPSPNFLTLALIAVATFEVSDTDLVHIIDAAVTDQLALTTVDVAELNGERQVSLSPQQLSAELVATGASPPVAHGLIDTGVRAVAPTELIAQATPTITETGPLRVHRLSRPHKRSGLSWL